MLSRLRLLAIALIAALVAVAVSMPAAQAAIAKVGGLTNASQDWSKSILTMRWNSVTGATYQARFAASEGALAKAIPIAARSTSVVSPKLNRCNISYGQVRAVKAGKFGPWSTPKPLKFVNRGPALPTITGSSLENAVKFDWNGVQYGSRYRVEWNPAPFGKFPGTPRYVGGGWLPQSARTATLNLPTTPTAGDRMVGLAYANAVFARISPNNSCIPDRIPLSKFIPVFPKAPDPGPGAPVRTGTYNVQLFPSGGDRIKGIAKNITDHKLDIVTLQEANVATANALKGQLDAKYRVGPPPPIGSKIVAQQQILYNEDKFSLSGSGFFEIPSPTSGVANRVIPWIKLTQTGFPPAGLRNQHLMVVAIHLMENINASDQNQKRDAGNQAAVALRNIDANNPDDFPVIASGDYRYLREPFGDKAGYVEGPPTFVRHGYYDSMAAVKKNGFQYTTVNDHKTQSKQLSGVGTRADYIMLKGFNGSVAYTNVFNWKYNGATPSDHNLVFADVRIPYLN